MGLMTVFITHQPAQRGKCRGRHGSGSGSGSPCSLICQPCDTSGLGLVMWFRWVSHAGVSQSSPFSAPATVPHYTPCHHQPYRQQALRFLTPGHPFYSVTWWHRREGGRKERQLDFSSLTLKCFFFLFVKIKDIQEISHVASVSGTQQLQDNSCA